MLSVQEILTGYLEAKPERTLGMVSRRTGVPHTTLRRIISGEARPTYENAVAILGAIVDRDSMMACLRRTFPETSATLERSVRRQSSNGRTALGPDELDLMGQFLQRDPHCLIVHMAATRTGTSLQRIEAQFGRFGLKALDELVDSGLLILKDKQIRLAADCFTLGNIRVCSATASRLVEAFDSTEAGPSLGTLGILGESINREGLRCIRETVNRCFAEVAAIKEDSTYAGDIPFFSMLVVGVLDDTEAREKSK